MLEPLLREFEEAWREGRRPSIEAMLEWIDEELRTEALEKLVALEIQLRVRSGEVPQIEEYLERFESDRSTIEELFAGETANGAEETKKVSLPSEAESVRTWLVDASGPDVASGAGPTEVGQYRILRRIAEGGMGVVYLARHSTLGRLVVLKTIKGDGTASREQVERFLQEARAAGRLHHPNMVAVYDVSEMGNQIYYAMQFIPGPSLNDVLRDGPIPSRDAAVLLRTIARTIAYAHERGIIHRDLKPANILLAPQSSTDGDRPIAKLAAEARQRLDTFDPMVTDFGLAKQLEADSGLTQSGQILGTPSFMAPEQAAGSSEVGPAADVYALGAILYACLTGRPPFQAAHVVDTLRLVLESDPLPPRQLQPGIDRDLETICLKCLQKSPSQRYASADAFASDLDRYLQGHPIEARPVPLWERTWRWCRRRPAVAALLTLLLVLAIAGPWTAVVQARLRREAEEHRQAALASAKEAREAAAEAQRQRKRAEANYAQSLTSALETADSRGDWQRLLELADKAAQQLPDQALKLRLMKLKALDGLSHLDKLNRETEELWKLPDKGSYAGEITLWWADVRTFDHTNDQTRTLLKQALDLGLPPAEAAYARALLAETTPQAIEELKHAVQLDPFHQRAYAILALDYVLLGQRDEARQIARAASRLFPHDARFVLAQVLVETMDENREEADRLLDSLRGKLPDAQLAAVRGMVELGTAIRLGDQWEYGKLTDVNLLTVIPKLAQARGAMPHGLERTIGRLPSTKSALSAYSPFMQKRSLWNLLSGQAPDLSWIPERAEHHPDGFLYFLHGFWGITVDHYEEAVASFSKAAELSHSFFSNQRESLFGLAVAHVMLAQQNASENKQPDYQAAVPAVRRYVAEGPVPEHRAVFLMNVARQAGDFALADDIAFQMIRQQPENPAWWLELARTCRLQGHLLAAVDYCDHALELAPENKDARELRARCSEELEKKVAATSNGGS